MPGGEIQLLYAKWEKVKRGDYVLLKNCKTGEYLHIENLTCYVEHGEVPTTWWSAQWTESEVDGYTRLINRWQPDYSIQHRDIGLRDTMQPQTAGRG